MWAPELHWVKVIFRFKTLDNHFLKGSYVVYFTAADDRDKVNTGLLLVINVNTRISSTLEQLWPNHPTLLVTTGTSASP